MMRQPLAPPRFTSVIAPAELNPALRWRYGEGRMSGFHAASGEQQAPRSAEGVDWKITQTEGIVQLTLLVPRGVQYRFRFADGTISFWRWSVDEGRVSVPPFAVGADWRRAQAVVRPERQHSSVPQARPPVRKPTLHVVP